MVTTRDPHITIARALPRDCSDLTTLARAAKAHWGYPRVWLDEWRDALTITHAYLKQATVYKATGVEAVVAFYALLPGSEEWELDHLWVSPAMIGRGVGRRILRHALATAKRLGADRLIVESDPNAAGFYERMGGTRVGAQHGRVAGTPRILPIIELPIP